jgi:4-hydroxy-2-oxoheptanedioate aldolase
MEFGLDLPAILTRANEETFLMPQIETVEAVKNIDAILGVTGLAGISIGPGDLSADLGAPMQFDNPKLHEMVRECVSNARARGLHAGILCGQEPLLDAALAAGADLLVASADYKTLIGAWRPQLERLRTK